MASMQAETNQKIAALTDRFNQQIAALQGENRALLMAMQPFMAGGAAASAAAVASAPVAPAPDAASSNLMQSLGVVASAAMTGMKRDSTDTNSAPAAKKSRQQ